MEKVSFILYITPEQKEQIAQAAKDQDVSMNQLIRKAIKSYLTNTK